MPKTVYGHGSVKERTTQFVGVLEIDHQRGVIYFHLSNPDDINSMGLQTLLRICHLPIPIPSHKMLDISFVGMGYNWDGRKRDDPKAPGGKDDKDTSV